MATSPTLDVKAGLDPAGTPDSKKNSKLGMVSGVFIPSCLNILSILMFLRFGLILGDIGFLSMLGLLIVAYCIDLLTTLSLSAIASNGEVKGGGAYYLISRSLGPEFGGSIGVLFYLAQVLNAALNIVGLIDCIRLYIGPAFPQGYWIGYGLQTAGLVFCSGLCLLGSDTFSKASNGLLVILALAVMSIPLSAVFKSPFHDEVAGVEFTGMSWNTLAENFLPHTEESTYSGLQTFRDWFGILFPATSGIFAGASMSGDLRDPSKSIPRGTLWAMFTTFVVYFIVIVSLAASTTHASLRANADVIPLTNLSAPIILAGECAVTTFSALMGIIGSAKLFQALARDKLLPGLSVFGTGTKKSDEPAVAVLLTYAIAQVALLGDLDQIATFISMGYQMTFFVMNLACFLLKIASAPNFRPSFNFFTWQTAFLGSLSSALAMFFIEETYAATAICVLVCFFLLIHYLCPPKRWGDVSQNLIYHQVRKYLLRLKPEHIKFWRPHIILLINDPRRQTRLIQFCNSMKKGSLYILGHVIVTDDFNSGVHEARLQQQAWTNYISEFSRIKAFVQLTMSPSITWGMRNLILSAGLGGMRPNIAVLGFYNMQDLRASGYSTRIPDIPASPTSKMRRPQRSQGKATQRRRGDTSARLLEGFLPTDVIRTESMMSPTEYMTMLEDLTLRYRLNVAVGYGFDRLETPRTDGGNTKKYIDLWPIQMSAEVTADGKNVLTTNFDTYTLILQLGHILRSVQTWRRVYRLRIMVFVEYESEVDEESARVQALLEKLRIDAEVHVFWLAAGQLNTYELIINGNSNDIDWDIVVNDTLKDEEWWDDLQMFRGGMEYLSSSQEMTHLAHIIDSTAGRPGVYNPHEDGIETRTLNVADMTDIPKKPAIAVLAKMGVNMGIHTHHLGDEVLRDSDSREAYDTEAESSDSEAEALFSPVEASPELSVAPFGRPNASDSPGNRHSSRSESQSLLGRSELGDNKPTDGSSRRTESPTKPSYGTMSASSQPRHRERESSSKVPRSSSKALDDRNQAARPEDSDDSRVRVSTFPTLDVAGLEPLGPRRSRSMSPIRTGTLEPPERLAPITPTRPSVSRQSTGVRFSSRQIPETRITVDGEQSRIGFATGDSSPRTPRPERPTYSRQSSLGKFSSRPVPETKVTGDETAGRTIAFADQPTYHPPSAPHSRHHSRNNSQYSTLSQGDISLSIPELLHSYKADPGALGDEEGGSSYATQGLALSFNDLPSRAQHLILNELMRQNSQDTAVLLSTLPIPSEGTSLDEEATVQYLSDIEVLCNELPPTLMVLSNNMTVTVSL